MRMRVRDHQPRQSSQSCIHSGGTAVGLRSARGRSSEFGDATLNEGLCERGSGVRRVLMLLMVDMMSEMS